MKTKKEQTREMNDYLKSAFNKLNSEDLRNIILWLLEKKTEVYNCIQTDIDADNSLIFLNELEEKLRNVYTNIVQREEENEN